jgi:hypothetical protein
MPSVDVRITPELDRTDFVRLYAAVGWTAYTREPDTIMAGLRGASFVVAAC